MCKDPETSLKLVDAHYRGMRVVGALSSRGMFFLTSNFKEATPCQNHGATSQPCWPQLKGYRKEVVPESGIERALNRIRGLEII